MALTNSPTPDSTQAPPPWWTSTSEPPPDPPDNTAGTGSTNGSSSTPTPTNCPPGWTAAPAGATPGSCTDPEGHVIGPEAAYLRDHVDSSYSLAQWQTWINGGNYDSKTHKFKPERTGPNGEVLNAWVDKPVDCPSGMTAYGPSKCLDEGDPRLTGGQIGGTPAPTPAPTGGPVPQGQSAYTADNPLQNALLQLFNTRAGIFGKDNPYLSGATPRTGADPITGTSLGGGGVWWGGGKDLASALAPFSSTFAPAPNVIPDPNAAIRTPVPKPVVPTDGSIAPVPKPVYNPSLYGLKRPRSPLEQAFQNLGVSY